MINQFKHLLIQFNDNEYYLIDDKDFLEQIYSYFPKKLEIFIQD